MPVWDSGMGEQCVGSWMCIAMGAGTDGSGQNRINTGKRSEIAPARFSVSLTSFCFTPFSINQTSKPSPSLPPPAAPPRPTPRTPVRPPDFPYISPPLHTRQTPPPKTLNPLCYNHAPPWKASMSATASSISASKWYANVAISSSSFVFHVAHLRHAEPAVAEPAHAVGMRWR